MKGPKELTFDQLNEARLKALRNAKELLGDAKLLFAHKRWPRVVFLCRVAEEEMGKYWYLVGARVVATAGKIDWKGFWKTFRSHMGKTQRLHHLELLGLKGKHLMRQLLELEKRANELERLRTSALYSDLSAKGFVSPGDVIGEKMAQGALKVNMGRLRLVELLEKKILKSGAALRDLTPEEVEAMLGEHRDTGI